MLWTDAPTGLGLYNATQGCYFQSGYTSIFSYSPRNFVRFGVLVINASGTANRTGQARVSLQFKPLFGQTLAGPPRRVNNLGSTTNGAFHPLTEVVPTAGFNRVRRTLDLMATSGDLKLEAAYQVSNTPDEEASWDTPVVFGSVVTSVGVSFGTTFATASLTKRYARFGVLAKNVSGSALEGGPAALRVDLRYVG